MSDDDVILSREAWRALADAVQRAIVDRGASRETRQAAFSALLGLVEAGVVVGAPQQAPASAPASRAGATRLAAG